MASQTYRLGAFELTAPIGKGGMAEVWSARHREFGGTAAVKMITDQAADERYRQVFFKEVRAHARLEHPAIVRLLDYGHVTADDQPPPGVEDGHPYLVMEAADGTLGSGGAPANWTQLRAILLQVLDGLAYSHARGVIHRDLKPDNVLRFGTGRAARYKLADFGIAHSLRREEHDLEASDATMGTPRYMSPEQFLGRWLHYGPPTDLYALGCMAYQMATGAAPFTASKMVLLAMEHVNSPMPPPAPRFEVPDRFENWLARLLEKRPADRFQWAAEAAHSLLELSHGFVSEAGDDDELTVESQPTELLSFLFDMTTNLFDMTTNVDEGELVDWSAPTMAASGPLPAPPGSGSVERERVEPIARAPIPFPRRWDTSAATSDHQVEGLGLFALREAPVVGMHAERDRLWDELHAVVTTGERRAILLEGGARAPLNELSEWLVVRAAETGAARGLKIFHSSAGGPREGLTGLLEDLFVSWALPDDDIRDRVESVLTDAAVDSELRAFDIAVLTAEILRGRGADTRPSTVATQTERHRAIARALSTVRGDEPLVLLIENAGLGRDSVEFVRHITAEGVGAILVVLAVRAVSQDRARVAHRELEELAAEEFSTSLKVPDYDTEEQAQLLHELLPLVPQTRDRLVSATVGDPVMARLLLTDLIAQKALTPRPNGFALSESIGLELSARAVVVRRLESCWEEQPGRALALEAAAVLGLSPDPQELQRLCHSQGVGYAGELGPVLEDHGLARSTEGRWWFVHEEIVQALLDRASQGGRLADLHRAAGEALLARATPDAASLRVSSPLATRMWPSSSSKSVA